MDEKKKNLLRPKVERQKHEKLLKNNQPTPPPLDLILTVKKLADT